MTVPILCLVSLIFLGWTFVLKAEISDLKKKNEKLSSLLKNKLNHIEDQVEASGGRRTR